jgi:antibiotic biosynthesis monooxygenase (ABM) superfamily enzyme
MADTTAPIVLMATITIRHGEEQAFTDWQVRHSAAVAKFPGFISADIVPIDETGAGKWTIILNFETKDQLSVWQQSPERASLVAETSHFAEKADFGSTLVTDAMESAPAITEVILSKIKPGQEEAYRAWTARIQMAQAKYPGYRGMFLQPPTSGPTGHWTTLLRFDTLEHLLAWKSSPERTELLNAARDIIESEELMRLATSFPGWVPVNPVTGQGPPNWKTAMLVLLGLYPIVMLEMRFLNPYLTSLNPSLATFIGNAGSVAVTSFITMPLLVRWFGWWLFADKKSRNRLGVLGLGIFIVLYALEIALLWHVLT